LTQQATLRDPTDLLIIKPDASVHWSQLRQYRMGLTSEADLVDLRAMDTAEDVIDYHIFGSITDSAIRATRNALSEQFPGKVATSPSE
jgi:hypothetical protein